MFKMGFKASWISLIIEGITTISHSILVNGEPKGMIHLTRGIRQGDLLSPFLFLFDAEGLNAILEQAADAGEIHGFSICRCGTKLTHPFFVDDCLLFYRSTLEECEKIKELLASYEVASGQMINKDKTTLFFNHKTDDLSRFAIQQALGVPAI